MKVSPAFSKFIPGLALGGYVLWLLSFPMQGYFLLKKGEPTDFPYFILAHTFTLFLIFGLAYRWPFGSLSFTATLLTALLTAFYPFGPFKSPWLIALIGVSSAFVIVRIGCLLGNNPSSTYGAAAGLILGNLFLAFFLWIKLPEKFSFPIMAFLLSLSLWRSPSPSKPGSVKDLYPFLPFISLFYLLIGISYVCLLPAYLPHAYFEGLELFFYIGAVALSARLFRLRPDYSLAAGVSMGIVAVAFLHDLNRLNSNLAMFSLQISAGFIDLFCIAFFLKGEDILRRFSLGTGCMLAGIALGFPLLYRENWHQIINLVGNLILGIGLVAFYLFRSSFFQPVKEEISSSPEKWTEKELIKACERLGIPREAFSYREWEILQLTLARKSIREIASLLQISESSVKTYLQRIYRKTRVSSKAELLKKFEAL